MHGKPSCAGNKHDVMDSRFSVARDVVCVRVVSSHELALWSFVRQAVSQVPVHRQQSHLRREPETGERH